MLKQKQKTENGKRKKMKKSDIQKRRKEMQNSTARKVERIAGESIATATLECLAIAGPEHATKVENMPQVLSETVHTCSSPDGREYEILDLFAAFGSPKIPMCLVHKT